MLLYRILPLWAILALACKTHAEPVVPLLSPAEAERQVVESRAAAEQKARSARENPAFTILSETTVVRPDGASTLYRRVAPPPPAPARSTARTSEPLDAEAIRSMAGEPLVISATVYDGPLTRLDWMHQGLPHTAWSNADFRLLSGIARITSAEADYSLVMALEVAGTSPANKLPFTPGQIEYFVLSDDPDPAAYAGIDALHTYYATHEPQLRINHQNRQLLNTARQQHQEATPPEPRVIHFWKVKSNN